MYRVMKRDGVVVDFDVSKISAAIEKAFIGCNKQYHPSVVDMLALRVTSDFETKINQVTKYLKKGAKIKVTIRFKGRQMAHTELGRDVMVKFADRLCDLSIITDEPKLDGRTMTMMLAPKK